MKKTVIVIALLALAAVLVGLLGDADWSLAGLKAQLQLWRGAVDARPVVSAFIAFLIYTGATGLSLPVAIPLTLLIAALFGFVEAFLIVSFGSSFGALMAFLSSRHLLADVVAARFGNRLKPIEEGIRKDGAFYLFTLRLVPLFPFFIINVLMGLTPISALTFYVVSQLGMLPGTVLYVAAGTELSNIENLSDILSPTLLMLFVAIGLFPWAARAVLRRVKTRALTAGYAKPARFDRHVVVIGGGAAGLVASNVAAQAGASVSLVEAASMGGECLNTGCVPSKALIAAAKAAHAGSSARRFGIDYAPPTIDFSAVMDHVRGTIAAIEPHDSAERYRGLGVDVIAGRAEILDPWRVAITAPDGERQVLATRAIIIATGSEPVIPPVQGLADAQPLTNETLWAALERDGLPETMAILGAGPMGVEISQSLARLGCRVTLIEPAPRILPREDSRAAAIIADALTAEGVTILTTTRVSAVRQENGQSVLTLDRASGASDISVARIVVAAGRRPRLSGLGLERLGLASDGRLALDDGLRTDFPSILACGDVAGRMALTSAAGEQGVVAALNALFGRFRVTRLDETVMPRAVFSDPEIASVGLSDDDAASRGLAVESRDIAESRLDRAIADGATSGFVRVTTAKGSDRIVGVTIVGPGASERIAEFALAMKAGIGLKRILGTVHAYPTRAEAARLIAGAWRKDHLSPVALRLSRLLIGAPHRDTDRK